MLLCGINVKPANKLDCMVWLLLLFRSKCLDDFKRQQEITGCTNKSVHLLYQVTAYGTGAHGLLTQRGHHAAFCHCIVLCIGALDPCGPDVEAHRAIRPTVVQ